LTKILSAGSIPAKELESKVYFSSTLKSLIEMNAVVRKPGRRGSWRYEVVDKNILEKFMQARFVDVCEYPLEMTAADAAVHLGDAHRATLNDHQAVTLRYINDSVVVRGNCGEVVDAQVLCDLGGALTLKLSEFSLEAPVICLVENSQSFWEAEHFFIADCYIYLSGQFSNVLLDWLASDNCCFKRLVHAGDYDPAGLMIYNRIAQRIPECELFVPSHLEELLMTYGNSIRLTKHQDNVAPLIESGNQQNRTVLNLLLKHSKTLDQEVLLK